MTGVVLPFVTVELISLAAVLLKLNAATLVTVPLAVAAKVPLVLKVNPLPIVTSPGTAEAALVLPNNF